ncbi:TPA: hypothetical protein ACXKGV_005292 [Klebsiella oxytoca]|uniref:hypothetical protein n=1 Tax=Klebsiella michiganensis TaxID=1134687 RepID=UPI0027E7A9C7|nr:hypothetical protein [Klebsiella michiganensis]HDP1328235.1 hypothetical protein [Klebsiella pneumoniae]HDT6006551.1 hypothetical protein [Klebsiella michiganensis]
MFKSLNTDWLKLALLRVFQSGWTVVILVGLSLLFCSFTGRQAFIVWWLTFAGVLLIGASVWLGNLPYRLLQPGNSARRWSGVLSWIIWGAGFLLLAVAPANVKDPWVLLFNPLAGLTAFLLWLWASHKEPLKWIR